MCLMSLSTILITCLLDIVWIFLGEVTCQFLLVVKLSLFLKALYSLFSILSNFNERCKTKENEDY